MAGPDQGPATGASTREDVGASGPLRRRAYAAVVSSTPGRGDGALVRPPSKKQSIPEPPGARIGPGAPWADRRSPGALDVDLVRRTFAAVGPPVRSPNEKLLSMPPSAVLAPMYESDGETWLVLTRRTMNLRAHRGEIAFPGGRSEPLETPEETARREAFEEIALAGDVDIVGQLDHLSTITSGSFIVPFVGVLDSAPTGLVPNPDEVDAILHVKLTTLLDPSRYRSEIWPMPNGTEHPIFFFDLDEDTLWGATAAMVRQLLGFLTGTVTRGDLQHT